MSFREIKSLEVRRVVGKHTKRGALIGVLPWVVVVTAAIASSGGPEESGATSAGAFAVLGVGVLAGAGIGSQIEKVDWVKVEVPDGEISDAAIEAVASEFASQLKAPTSQFGKTND